MMIFSNFDTGLKRRSFKEAQEKFGAENVLLITRSGVFEFFNSFLPLVLLIAIWGIFVAFWLVGDMLSLNREIKTGIALILFVPMIFSVLVIVIKKYIDYSMDFCIITPQEIMAFNQTGFFHRAQRNIESEKVKTITIRKDTFWSSIFDYGDVDFLAEGDSEKEGDIKLNYVSNPEHIQKEVNRIFDLNHNAE